MCNTLLEKVRQLNLVLQESSLGVISYEKLSGVLGLIMDANIYIVADTGELLGVHYEIAEDSVAVTDPETGIVMMPEIVNNAMLAMTDTTMNLTGREAVNIFSEDGNTAKKLHSFFPIKSADRRLGTIAFTRYEKHFDEDDVILGEYGSTLVGLAIIRAEVLKKEELDRVRAVVVKAIETLSYSEIEAVKLIFDELNAKEGLLVASKIADRSGITRSVIVNALRKLESAGVIESRSLGMKGTHIKVLNDQFLDELSKTTL
ncbi:MAG: GTP-sensing pleiotropic transcriptional regulator CodY [Clostridiales Family XIII bacterium]|jgi:transcriptional pleiotropic repressor|nr:GTP-sensing pleiotropic transcriptional regulator CodY [Clostridiales Family XIII bacterium]